MEIVLCPLIEVLALRCEHFCDVIGWASFIRIA